MTSYSEYYLNSRASVVQLELLEIAHPDFTKTFRIVRNARDGVTVDLAPDEQDVAFQYYPAKVQQLGALDSLDSSIQIDFGDLGTVIPPEMDSVAEAGGFLTKPSLRYWSFRSDVLNAPIFGPILLEIPTFSFSEDGASFEAKAPVINSTKTGTRYSLNDFPMLRGLL